MVVGNVAELKFPQLLLAIEYTELIVYISAGVFEEVHEPLSFQKDSQSFWGSNSDAIKLPETDGYK